MAGMAQYLPNAQIFLAILPFFALLIYVSHPFGRLFKRKNNYPPGPNPSFLVGNWFDFPHSDDASQYMEWENKYNSMFTQAFRSIINFTVRR